MNSLRLVTLAFLTAAGTLISCASDKSKSDPKTETASGPMSVEESATVVSTARVESIDYATRRVTLRSASGRLTAFTAGPQVQRLNEVKVGDNVRAEFTATVLAELRPPTAEEADSPLTVVEVGGRGTQASDPAGGVARGVKIVTTIAAIDQPNMLITLRGPMGDTAVVKARNPDNVKKMKIGDTIVITYVESTVVSLEKASN